MTVVIPAPPSSVLSGAPLPSADPDHFILPDLVGHCNFPLAFHPHGYPVAAESVLWLDAGCPELSPKARKALFGLQAGELTAFCYPYCSPDRLRVVSDFMNYLFHLDNICDEMDDRKTVSTAGEVIGALRDPHGFHASSAVGRLTQW